MGSVMVTGTRTRSTSTLSGRTCALRPFVAEIGSGLGASFGFSSSRGWTWTSLTSVVCAKAVKLRQTEAQNARRSEDSNRAENGFFRTVGIGSLERTGAPHRSWAVGLDDRRNATRAINTSIRRMLAQLAPSEAGFLSKSGDNRQI